MIIVYEGVPGSGKTYDAVRKIVDNLRLGRKVYTNIEGMDAPTCLESLKFVSGLNDFDFASNFNFLDGDQIFGFWERCDHGSLIVLDEIHKWFNARDWSKDENRRFADWASTHRHFGYDLILISQRIEKIDSQIRSLVEWTYRYKKINFVGNLIRKSYVVFAFVGEDTDDPLSKQIRTYDKKIFACYQSYVNKDVKELGIQKHSNILKHPVFLSIPILIIFTIYQGFNSGVFSGDLFGTKKIQERLGAVQKVDMGLPKGVPPEPKKIMPSIPGPASGAGAGMPALPAPGSGASGPGVKLPPLPGSVVPPEPKQEVKRVIAIVNGMKIIKEGNSITRETVKGE